MTEQQLYTLLSTDAGISGIVGSQVFGGWLPEGTPLPALTFAYVSDRPINDLDGDSGSAHNRYTINAWAGSYADAQALKDAIKSAMSAYPRLALVPLHDEKNNLFRFALDYSVLE